MGSVNIDNTGSGADVTLSSDGTDLLLDGTAIGGGGGGSALELYVENPSSPTAPSATGSNAVAIGNGASSTSQDSFAIGRDTTASNFYTVALGYQAVASGSQALAGPKSTASGSQSVCLGVLSTAAGGTSVVVGPQASTSATATDGLALGRYATSAGAAAAALGKSYASGTDSFAAVIDNNTSSYGATVSNSIAIGQNAKATGARAYALGRNSIASSVGSYCIGDDSIASQFYAMAYGKKAKSDVQGKHAFGTFTVENSGNIQGGLHVLYVTTTDATAVALSTSSNAASTVNQVILPNNSAYAFHGTIVARQKASAGTDYASWEIKGALLRDANAASTVLGNGIKNKLYASAGASAWDIALTADTTNGGLAITVTGAAATNIRWVATVNTSEVTYA